MTTAMRAAIRPYSMAVTPRRSLEAARKDWVKQAARRTRLFIIQIFLKGCCGVFRSVDFDGVFKGRMNLSVTLEAWPVRGCSLQKSQPHKEWSCGAEYDGA